MNYMILIPLISKSKNLSNNFFFFFFENFNISIIERNKYIYILNKSILYVIFIIK